MHETINFYYLIGYDSFGPGNKVPDAINLTFIVLHC